MSVFTKLRRALSLSAAAACMFVWTASAQPSGKAVGRGGGCESEDGSFIDRRDRKTYKTVRIGGQTWMAENLDYQPKSGKSSCYGGDISKCEEYGRLYDWNTARTVCPAGWRLPSREEWNALAAAAGGKAAGKALKSSSGWNGNGNGTDGYGFSALAGGGSYPDGKFDNIGNYGHWWTAAESGGGDAYCRRMVKGNDIAEEHITAKGFGFSVRCVKD